MCLLKKNLPLLWPGTEEVKLTLKKKNECDIYYKMWCDDIMTQQHVRVEKKEE
jgi:hypothetical protein